MENKTCNVLNKWSYVEEAGRRAPHFWIAVYSPFGRLPDEGEICVRVDTGYDGDLLLSYDDYVKLGLDRFELPTSEWSVGETVSGEVVLLRASMVEVELPGVGRIPMRAETFKGNREALVGLGALNRLVVVLDGKEKSLMIVEQAEPPKQVNPTADT